MLVNPRNGDERRLWKGWSTSFFALNKGKGSHVMHVSIWPQSFNCVLMNKKSVQSYIL